MTIALKKSVLLFLGMVCLVLITKAQGLEDELGFKYVKAKYLMETERYEDAIQAFSAIINSDAQYEDAMLQRAEAKYKMAAYKGTKKDVLRHIELNGATEDALALLGKAEYKMKNYDAALNTLLVASAVVVNDGQVYEYIGNIYYEKDQLIKACGFYEEGSAMSSKCRSMSKKLCGNTAPDRRSSKDEEVVVKKKKKMILKPKKENSEDDTVTEIKGNRTKSKDDVEEEIDAKTKTKRVKITELEKNEEKIEKAKKEREQKNEEAKEVTKEEPKKEEKTRPTSTPNYDMPPEDDTENEIIIDDELSIYIYGSSLGKRKVLETPNILILSETSGKVAVDVCINRRGKVESAELNTDETTIEKQSLISLAIRKAKDFWFERGKYKEQCGVIVFDIKGS